MSCNVYCSVSTAIAVRKSECSRSQDIHCSAQNQHYLQDPDSTLPCLQSVMAVMAVLSVELPDVFLPRYGS